MLARSFNRALVQATGQRTGSRLLSTTACLCATGRAAGVAPKGGRTAQKRLKKKGDKDQPGAAGGVDPGTLVNETYIKPPPYLKDLPELDASAMVAQRAGGLFRFPTKTLDELNGWGLPSLLAKEWKLNPEATTVLRRSTMDLKSHLDSSAAGSGPSLLTLKGKPGSGKSVAMLQALSYAVQQGWIILYIPDAITLVNGRHGFAYSPETKTYHQSQASSDLLRLLLASSKHALSRLPLSKAYDSVTGVVDDQPVTSSPLAASAPLSTIIERGVKDRAFAPRILEIVMEELAAQTERPVLVAVDSVQALYRPSDYRDPSFNRVDSFALSLPRLLLRLTTAELSLKRGMTMIAHSSTDPFFTSPAYTSAIASPSLPSSPPHPPTATRPSGDQLWPGWSTYSALAQPLVSTPSVEIPPLDRSEAAGVFLSLHKNRLGPGPVSDQAFLRHLVASDGNAREFRREVVAQAV